MKIHYLLFFILLSFLNWGRSQSPLAIKEHYDYTHSKVAFNGVYSGIVEYIEYSNPLSEGAYGEQLGYVLESYINMYKTTKDKAYLIKFINKTLQIMSWRNTNYRFNDQHFYMNGILLWPMAHFSSLVLAQEPNLINESIPSGLIVLQSSTFAPNVLPSQNAGTYGAIAHWLVQKQVETLDAIITEHWLNHNQGFKQETDHEYGLPINMQAGFGGALLYLGQLSTINSTYSGLGSYLEKGADIARLYKSDVDLDDKCNCFLYQEPVLRTTTNNAYWWYHAGWKITYDGCAVNACPPYVHFNKQPQYPEYTQFVEDISHGVTTMIVPHVAYEIGLFTHGNYPFSDVEMIRFRNMFTKDIFDGNTTSPGFHNAVNGADAPVSPSGYDNQFNAFKYTSMAYMPLYKFDGLDNTATAPDVYDIVLKFFENDVYTSPGNLSGGLELNGISQTVSAQWEKECVNLTMYNRKMIYDQDFFVKNKLIIDPEAVDNFHELGDPSFAEPTISNNKFTIEEGITVNMVAGESITLKPGFHAIAGCNFHASILPSSCTDGKSTNLVISNNPGDKEELDVIRNSKTIDDIESAAAFAKKNTPETNNKFTAAISNNELTIRLVENDYFQLAELNNPMDSHEFNIVITNLLGQQILDEKVSFDKSFDKSITFNLENYPKGTLIIYLASKSEKHIVRCLNI